MGRKSAKGKEKKMKRLEERAGIAASKSLVDTANAIEDPLASLQPFKKFDRNGLSLTINSYKVETLDEELVNWAFKLTKANMQTLYEKSDSGWDDKGKKEEMTEDNAQYLIAKDADNKPVALVHYRFELEEGDPVLYCYEVQLINEVRRKNLGKFLMQILELLAHRTRMQKVMLTVFKHNPSALSFFKDKLKYEIDETSPEDTMEEKMLLEDGYTYEILSKKIVPRGAPLATKPQSNGHAKTTEGRSCACPH